MAICGPGKEPSPDTGCPGTLISDFQPPACEEQLLSLKLPSVAFYYSSSTWLRLRLWDSGEMGAQREAAFHLCTQHLGRAVTWKDFCHHHVNS